MKVLDIPLYSLRKAAWDANQVDETYPNLATAKSKDKELRQ